MNNTLSRRGFIGVLFGSMASCSPPTLFLNINWKLLGQNIFPNTSNLTLEHLMDKYKIPRELLTTTYEYNPDKPSRPKGNTLTVSSWNIAMNNAEKVYKAIESNETLLNSDIIAMQEVFMKVDGSNVKLCLEEVADKLGMAGTYGVQYLPKDINSGNNAIGNLILSRYEIDSSRIIRLPAGFDIEEHTSLIGTPLALSARVNIDGTPLDVYSVHLDSITSPYNRGVQMKSLLDDIEFDNPMLIAGDFNILWNWFEIADDYIRQCGFDDPFGLSEETTINNKEANMALKYGITTGTLDRIFSRNVTVKDYIIHDDIDISDHYPITVVYEV